MTNSPFDFLGRRRNVYPNDAAFGWRDITGDILTRGVGATDPAWTQVGTGPFYAYAFALNDVAWINFHIPHDIVPNSDIHIHAHWFTDGTDTEVVKWQFDYTHALGFNQEAFSETGANITAEEAGPGVQYQHMVTESAGISLSNLTEPDGIMQVRVSRITNGGTDNADNVFLLTADVHYQSTNMATYGKAPNFYGV